MRGYLLGQVLSEASLDISQIFSLTYSRAAPSPHPFQSSSLLRTDLLFGDAFSKENEVSKGVSDKNSLRPHGLASRED
jgi:hypothetical protein